MRYSTLLYTVIDVNEFCEFVLHVPRQAVLHDVSRGTAIQPVTCELGSVVVVVVVVLVVVTVVVGGPV